MPKIRHIQSPGWFGFWTGLVFSALTAATVSAAPYTLNTTYWNQVVYASGTNDYFADQQTSNTSAACDLVGVAGHPASYWYMDTSGTSSLTDGSLSFRVRLAESGKNGQVFELVDSVIVGIDANRDGRLDAIAAVRYKGPANQVGVFIMNPGTGLNDGPNTTSIMNSGTGIWYQSAITSGVNYDYKAVTTTLDPGGATNYGSTSTNYFVDFTIPFNSLVTGLQTNKSLNITDATPLSFVVMTGNSLNAINEDVGGIYGIPANTDTTTWTDLKAITPPARSGGAAPLIWTGLGLTNSNEWSENIITGSKNWRSAIDSSTQDFLTGDFVTFDDSAKGTTLVTMNVANVNPSRMVFSNGTLVYTLTGIYGITGTAALEKTGTGLIVITNTNMYTGGTQLGAGTIAITNSSALSTGTISMGSATLRLNGTSGYTLSNLITTTGAAVLNAINPAGVTLNGQITGTGSLTKTGSGFLALTTSNSYSGGTTLADGTLSFAANSLGSAGNVVFASGTLQWNGTNTQDLSSRFVLNNGGTAAMDTNGNNVTLASGFGAGSTAGVNKLGAGTLTLTASNGYSGTTTISAGTLQIGNGGATGTLGSGPVVDNGSLAVNRSNTYTIAQAITGSGSFQQLGTGTTFLTGSNNYTGTTTITAGALEIGNGGATGTLGSGPVVDNGSLILNRSNTYTIAQAVTGTGSLQQTGAGTTILTSSNSYSGGSTLANGMLSFAANSLGSAGNVVFASGTLQWNGTNTQDLSSRFVLNNGGTAAMDTNGNNVTLASAFGAGSTAGVTKLGAGTLTVTASNGYSGTTTISGGTLQIGNGGATGTLASGPVVDNGTLAFNRSDTYTLATSISGTGRLVQNGSGTLLITSSNSATGDTLINNGTLSLAPGSSVGGNMVVNGGSTLQGRGTIYGGLTLNPSGTVNLLTSNLAVVQDVVFNGGALLSTITNSATYGQITVESGNVSLGEGTTTLSYTAPPSLETVGPIVLIDNQTAFKTTSGYFQNLPNGAPVFEINGVPYKIYYNYNLANGSFTGNDVVLLVPEPAGALLVILAGAGLLVRRRRAAGVTV